MPSNQNNHLVYVNKTLQMYICAVYFFIELKKFLQKNVHPGIISSPFIYSVGYCLAIRECLSAHILCNWLKSLTVGTRIVSQL